MKLPFLIPACSYSSRLPRVVNSGASGICAIHTSPTASGLSPPTWNALSISPSILCLNGMSTRLTADKRRRHLRNSRLLRDNNNNNTRRNTQLTHRPLLKPRSRPKHFHPIILRHFHRSSTLRRPLLKQTHSIAFSQSTRGMASCPRSADLLSLRGSPFFLMPRRRRHRHQPSLRPCRRYLLFTSKSPRSPQFPSTAVALTKGNNPSLNLCLLKMRLQ